jgi:tRNA U34 5-methylaminomethyl-2-thiouridine-forming methyltransferase MnmC
MKIVETSDGSKTVYNEKVKEHYHSTFGAVQESKHVFIEAGFNFVANNFNHFNILEVGFGTGLNALLTYFESEKKGIKINYVGVEPEMLSEKNAAELNYEKFIDNNEAKGIFTKIHSSPNNYPFYLSDNFILNKLTEKVQDIAFKPQSFGLVYFDAFSPEAQPELWTKEIFKNIYDALITNSVLVTYCVKGDVKRALKEVGFEIEKIPGPEGKREILRALKV